jgi:mannitol-1-phosphate 5-dehydrogenase
VGQGKKKVVVMACENAIMGTDILKKAMIDSGEITLPELNEVGVYPNTAVDRMVFDGEHHGKKGIEVGDAYELAIEADKLVDSMDHPIQKAEYVDNIDKFLKRKIYMVNCGHAVTSYLGFVKGYQTVQEALKDETIVTEMKNAVMESAAALEKEFGLNISIGFLIMTTWSLNVIQHQVLPIQLLV